MGVTFSRLQSIKKVRNRFNSFLRVANKEMIRIENQNADEIATELTNEYINEASKAISKVAEKISAGIAHQHEIIDLKHAL